MRSDGLNLTASIWQLRSGSFDRAAKTSKQLLASKIFRLTELLQVTFVKMSATVHAIAATSLKATSD
jgi:hypothetical protein